MSEFSPQTQAAKKPEFPPPRIIREDFLPGKQTRHTMPELSRQAQVVIDAYRSGHLSINNLAAALRAAADQVVPKEIEPANAFEEEGYVPGRLREQRQETRRKLLAIAAELRGNTTPTETRNITEVMISPVTCKLNA